MSTGYWQVVSLDQQGQELKNWIVEADDAKAARREARQAPDFPDRTRLNRLVVREIVVVD